MGAVSSCVGTKVGPEGSTVGYFVDEVGFSVGVANGTTEGSAEGMRVGLLKVGGTMGATVGHAICGEKPRANHGIVAAIRAAVRRDSDMSVSPANPLPYTT